MINYLSKDAIYSAFHLSEVHSHPRTLREAAKRLYLRVLSLYMYLITDGSAVSRLSIFWIYSDILRLQICIREHQEINSPLIVGANGCLPLFILHPSEKYYV